MVIKTIYGIVSDLTHIANAVTVLTCVLISDRKRSLKKKGQRSTVILKVLFLEKFLFDGCTGWTDGLRV